MLEKEIKILEIPVEEVVSKLKSLGAQKTFEGIIHDIYYDFPDELEHKMEANGRMFRLRKKGEEHIYTIKNKRKEIKVQEGLIAKEEHEMSVTNIESFAKVLEKYGMQKTREKKKHRISYHIGKIVFDIDDYQNGIPPLLEIEAQTAEEITTWQATLGLSEYKTLVWGSRKLFRKYNIEYNYLD